MRDLSIEDMDFIAGGYDYGDTVEVTAEPMTWYEQLAYDAGQLIDAIGDAIGDAVDDFKEWLDETPADRFNEDLQNIRDANPGCEVTGKLTANDPGVSANISTNPSVNVNVGGASGTYEVKCP